MQYIYVCVCVCVCLCAKPSAIFHIETTLFMLYFPYSTSEGSALSGIENCQLEVHTRHTKQLETHGVVLSSVE